MYPSEVLRAAMTMYVIKKVLLAFFLLIIFKTQGQSDLTGFWEPEVAVNYKVKEGYKHNFSVRKRSFIRKEDNTVFDVRQIDVSHFSGFKVSRNIDASFGIMYRFREEFDNGRSDELRLTQQFNYAYRPLLIRFGHRIRAEQRITSERTVHRFRYRFAIDSPLNGETTDVGEAYIVASTEALLSVASAISPEYDQRVTVQMGWLLAEGLRLQTGIEYRIEDYTNGKDHVAFLLSSLIFSL